MLLVVKHLNGVFMSGMAVKVSYKFKGQSLVYFFQASHRFFFTYRDLQIRFVKLLPVS
jgi:hypothetical protein